MLDADVNALFFHNMDELFDTRVVTRAGPVSPLLREDAAPPGLKFEGKAYSYDQFAEATYTNAFLVIRDGKIVFEDYRNNTHADMRFIGFSMSKSITSMLIGIAIEHGDIKSVDDLAVEYAPELRGSGYDGVTIRQILEMRSGVDYEERYDFGENPSLAANIHENAIVQNKERFADRAQTIKRKVEPGSRFNYATLDTAVLGRVLEGATGQAISKFMSEHLWEPAGMEYSGFWIADGPPGVGRELNGMGYNATLRDFGRLGLLMLNDGKLGDRQIVPEAWVRASTKMKPIEGGEFAGPHSAYGYQWWKLDDRAGSFIAVGLQGQFIYVDPRSKTVIVKLSYFPPDAPEEITDMTVAYFNAIIGWSPAQPR
ncbi:serine hydrolase domain-containing protein [Hyphococcus luteus]|nr:serine hydrolase [Marinicaulis flavus]